MQEIGVDGQRAVDVLGRIVSDVERAVVAIACHRGVGVVRLPGHEAVNLTVLQGREHRRAAGREAHGLDLRDVGAGEPRAGLEQELSVAVRRRAKRQTFEIFPGLRLDVLGKGEALAAGKHAGDHAIILKVLFFHQADIDVTHHGDVDLIGHQRQLQIGVTPHWHDLELNTVFLCEVLNDHHIGLMNLDCVGKSNLVRSLRLGSQPKHAEEHRY